MVAAPVTKEVAQSSTNLAFFALVPELEVVLAIFQRTNQGNVCYFST